MAIQQPRQHTNALIRQRRLVRIWDLWTRGCTNKGQIAAALGVSVYLVSKDMKCLMQDWLRQQSMSKTKKLAFRIQQLNSIQYEARIAFDRSRQNAEEHSSVTKTCDECRGMGAVTLDDDVTVECPTCAGKGSVITETVKSRGQAGDASFLRVASMCATEAAKLEGLYHPREDPGLGSVFRAEITNIHNQINIADGGPNPFAKASPQVILP